MSNTPQKLTECQACLLPLGHPGLEFLAQEEQLWLSSSVHLPRENSKQKKKKDRQAF